MVVQLSPELVCRIQTQIASGQFQTEEEVIREALNTLERRQAGLNDLARRVREAEADLQAGRGGPFDAEATKRAVHDRLRRQGVTD